MWQKCPICNGTGEQEKLTPDALGRLYNKICRTCDGTGMVNSRTGHPPVPRDSKADLSITIEGDFRKLLTEDN